MDAEQWKPYTLNQLGEPATGGDGTETEKLRAEAVLKKRLAAARRIFRIKAAGLIAVPSLVVLLLLLPVLGLRSCMEGVKETDATVLFAEAYSEEQYDAGSVGLLSLPVLQQSSDVILHKAAEDIDDTLYRNTVSPHYSSFQDVTFRLDGQYDTLTGVMLHSSEQSCIEFYGDDALLYTLSGTGNEEAQEFTVPLNGCSVLTILLNQDTEGICLAELRVCNASGQVTGVPYDGRTLATWLTDLPLLEISDYFYLMTPPEEYDFSNGVPTNHGLETPLGYGDDAIASFALDGKYTTLIGTYGPSIPGKWYSGYLRLYADGALIYDSGTVYNDGAEPVQVAVDVTGCQVLTVGMVTESHQYFSDVRLYNLN